MHSETEAPQPQTLQDAAIAAMAADAQTPVRPSASAGHSAGAQPSSTARAGSGAETTDVDAGSMSAADGGAMMAASEDSSCLDTHAALDREGTFQFEAKSTQTLKLWLPKLPSGCRAPVVHFANGTGAACANYQMVLERLASHGFLAVCAETTVTGSGVPGLQALQAVLDMYPNLAAHKLGSAGHEAGGQGAILTLQQAEAKWGAGAVYAGMAIAPASGIGTQPPGGTWQAAYATVASPMFVMSGSADALTPERWVGDGFAALNDSIEAYWYSGVEAPAIPVPQSYIQEAAIAWFRWKLLGDNAACTYFKQLPQSERWDKRAEQNVKDCEL